LIEISQTMMDQFEGHEDFKDLKPVSP